MTHVPFKGAAPLKQELLAGRLHVGGDQLSSSLAEIRAGINTRNVAVSGDGRYVMAANYLPHSLVLLDADLNLIKVLETRARDGG